MDILPVKDVQECFKKNCTVLVSRVISKYCTAFKHMQDVVTYHINHIYCQEMEQKSEIVSVYCMVENYDDYSPPNLFHISICRL